MKIPCSSCGRLFQETDGFTRCRPCRERMKVYVHTLHRRRGVRMYRGHRCGLCRKHKTHVRLLLRRWDKRGIYIWKRCREGHRWFVMGGQRDVCPKCAWQAGQDYLRSLERRRG